MRGKDRKVPPLFLSGRCTTPPSPAAFGSWSTFDVGLAALHWEGAKDYGYQVMPVGMFPTSPGGSVYRADFDVYADAWHMDRVLLSRGRTGAAVVCSRSNGDMVFALVSFAGAVVMF